MERSLVSENLVFLVLPGESWRPGQLGQMLRQSLREAGLPLWPAADTELFSAGGQSLFIARRPRRFYIELQDLEQLLAALPHCPADTALYALPKGYLLAMDSKDLGLWPREFGLCRRMPETWEAGAREQGLCLSRDAVGELLPPFGVKAPSASGERMG